MTDATPDPEIQTSRRGMFSRLSLVWLVPIVALLISLAVVWRTYADRGPLIEIAFENAAGIMAGETQVRYRDVSVGVVEEVTFSPDLRNVVVKARIEDEVAPFIDDDAQFWVVRPEVTAQGVTGIDTVLSGVYIAGSWNNEAGEARREFDGLPSAPLVRNDAQGLTIVLRSDSVEGLSEGTPILYRGINVGQIGNLRLAENGLSVVADGFIQAPESQLVTTATRFWDTSGFSFRFGPQGAQLDVSSIASLVTGGIAFDTTFSGGEAVQPGAEFRLYEDQDSARNSVFSDAEDGPPVYLSVIFRNSVAGLERGAEVDYQGIVVGQVDALTGVVDPERFGDNAVRLLATIQINPGRMGLPTDATREEVLDFLQRLVQQGLRAQLQSASILGGLRVALTEFDDVDEAQIDLDAEPYPLLPSIEADLSDFADTAEGVFNRINNLPIEELLASAVGVMDSVNRLLNDEALTDTPSEALALLGDVRSLIGSEGVQGLPDDASAVLTTLQGTVAELQELIAELNEQQAVASLVAALDAAEEAADDVTDAMDGVPELIADVDSAVQGLDALLQSTADLPLDQIVDRANAILGEVNTLLASPATQGLTAELSSTLGTARDILADLREGDLVGSATGTLEQAQSAMTEIRAALIPVLAEARRAAGNIGDASDDLPQITRTVQEVANQLDALAGEAAGLPLEELTRRASDLLDTADTLLGSESTAALPGSLNRSLDELRRLLIAVQEGGLIENANQTFASARDAADAVASASNDLPDVVARLNALLSEADGVIAGYDSGGALGSEARSALREIRDAARSVNSLARAIERSPNSLILGR